MWRSPFSARSCVSRIFSGVEANPSTLLKQFVMGAVSPFSHNSLNMANTSFRQHAYCAPQSAGRLTNAVTTEMLRIPGPAIDVLRVEEAQCRVF